MGVKGSFIDKTATKSKLVSKLNSMVMLSKKIIFWYIHHSPISMWETVFQFNGNLMTQFNKGEDYEGMRAIKILEFENTRRNLKKSVAINEIKKETMSDKSYISTRGIYLQKSPRLFTLQVN